MMADLKIAYDETSEFTEADYVAILGRLEEHNGKPVLGISFPPVPTRLTRWQRTKRWLQKRLGIKESVYLKDTDGRLM